MNLQQRILLIAITLVIASCSSQKPMRAVDYVDLERFMGDWYVIANIPTFLEKDAFNPVESYRLDDDGSVATTFSFNDGSLSGEKKIYNPRGFIKDKVSNAIWGMQFVWPIKADYRIVYLDDAYQQTIIGRTSRDYVWIMSRTAHISDQDYSALVSQVSALGYDIELLQKAVHSSPKPTSLDNALTIEKIEYSAVSREKSERAVLQKGRYSYFLDNQKVIQNVLTTEQKQALAKILTNIDVATIKDLSAPSTRHQFDGAMVTSLAITSEGTTHRSVTFDDDNPPKALTALIDFLMAMNRG